MSLLLFFIGFFILIKGSNILVDGATRIAKIFKISSWVIGVTIVGIGTSIPEFSITVLSSWRGVADFGLGTIIGSNTFNILFILGVCALICPLAIKKEWVFKDLTLNILAVLVVWLFVSAGSLNGLVVLTRLEGFVLFGLFLVWLFYVLSRRADDALMKKQSEDRAVNLAMSLFLVVAGIASVWLGAQWVVSGALDLAKYFGVSDSLVGLTLVGLGTSLPELSVSVVAALRRNFAVSIGNVVGSNIFDFLGILGTAAIVHPLVFPKFLYLDLSVTLASAFLLFLILIWKRRFIVGRMAGVSFIVLYIFYLAFLVYRG